MPISIAIVGGGKIARDRHVPTITADPDFVLAAAVTTEHAPLPGVANFRTIAEMKAAMPVVAAVALCTPPQGRHGQAIEALAADLDILNEKPPAATVEEAEDFAARAQRTGKVLYQTWHSREAAAVEPARAWLAGKTIRRVQAVWKEDARVWHPGQEWIWQPGIGVFDPGINAISVLTRIMPSPLILTDAELRFPQNKAAPVAATLAYRDGMGVPVAASFDFDHKEPHIHDIAIDTDGGVLTLSSGATKMAVDGHPVEVGNESEYARLYRRFATLLRARTGDVDFVPFRHVADAFLRGRRVTVAPFE